MPANQKNSTMYTYVDDAGTTWNKRGPVDTAINAIDGHSDLTTGAPVWPTDTRRFHVRRAVFYDPTTFRTVRFPVFTADAYAAIAATPPTLSVNVPGETAAVTYVLSELIPEKQPVAKTSRNLADHS